MAEPRDTFTKRVERVLTIAEEEAIKLQHNYVGQEHLLLGLVMEADGLAGKILAEFGVTEQLAREAILTIVGPGSVQPTPPLVKTPRAQKALELAVEQARQFGHTYVGTEHLLLGLLVEGGGLGANALAGFEVTIEKVQEELRRRMVMEPQRGPQGIRGVASQLIERQRGVRRYSLVLPEDLFQQVQQLAESEQTSVVELLRRFTKLGLLVHEIQQTPGSSLVIRQADNSEQRLVVL
jgi:ATP-dependent Clp protease ATP-binding subunit ClpC